MSISCAHCAVYFCGIQNVYELQKFLARDVNKKQRRQSRLTVTTSAMVAPLQQFSIWSLPEVFYGSRRGPLYTLGHAHGGSSNGETILTALHSDIITGENLL